jgi:hypothetical protein
MLLIVATRQGRLAGEPADPSPLEILSVSSDDADAKQEEQDGGVVIQGGLARAWLPAAGCCSFHEGCVHVHLSLSFFYVKEYRSTPSHILKKKPKQSEKIFL